MDSLMDFDREMEAQAALARALRRSIRWQVLKDWRALQRKLKQAQENKRQPAVTETVREINQLKEYYGDILAEALPLSERAWKYRKLVRDTQERRAMKPGEMDELWQQMVINHPQ